MQLPLELLLLGNQRDQQNEKHVDDRDEPSGEVIADQVGNPRAEGVRPVELENFVHEARLLLSLHCGRGSRKEKEENEEDQAECEAF